MAPRQRVSYASSVLLIAATACTTTHQHIAPVTPVQTRLYADIAYLSSQKLAGRLTGTPGNDSAATFIAHRYADLAMIGAFSGASCGSDKCENSFFQFFRVSPMMARSVDVPIDDKAQNVGALILGTDSTVRDEYVVVGAHYDHLGRSTTLSRAVSIYHFVHPGADDNASGTAAVLELARRFVAHPPRRSILFVNFSAEELGLIGSQVFVGHLPVRRDSIVAMVNLDMVGRLRDDNLLFFSGQDHDRFPALVDRCRKAGASAGVSPSVVERLTRGFGSGFFRRHTHSRARPVHRLPSGLSRTQ